MRSRKFYIRKAAIARLLLLTTVVPMILLAASMVAQTNDDARQANLVALAQAYKLGSENTGALAALYKSLPDVASKFGETGPALGAILDDFEILGDKIKNVRSPVEYKQLLADPITEKYNIAKHFPIWDPFAQASTVDRTERAIEDRISGTNVAIAQSLAGATTPNIKQAMERLNESILGIPRDLSLELMRSNPTFSSDQFLLDLASRVVSGADPSAIVRDGARSLLTRAAEVSNKARTDLVNAPRGLVPSRGWHDPSPIAFNKENIQTGASALFALAAIAGDRQAQRAIQDAARIADAAAKAYQVSGAIIAAASTGVGTFAAMGALLNVAASLGASGSDDANPTLLSFEAMLDYMKQQFTIVNSKLDYLISALDRIEGRVDQVAAALAGVIYDIQSINGQLEAIKRIVQQTDFNLAASIWDAALSECETLVQGNAFESRERYIGCIGAFLKFGESGSSYPFVLSGSALDGVQINELLNSQRSDAVSFSRYFPVAIPLIRNLIVAERADPIADLNCPRVFINQAVVSKAAQYLTLMQVERPTWFPTYSSPPTSIEENLLLLRIATLRDHAKGAESLSSCLIGPDNAALTERLATLDRAYIGAVSRVTQRVRGIHLEAGSKFLEDVRNFEANTQPSALAPWSFSVPRSGPRFRGIAFCPGETPSGDRTPLEIKADVVSALPKYFTKSYEVFFNRGVGDQANEKTERAYICVAEDRSGIRQFSFGSNGLVRFNPKFKLRAMLDERIVASIEVTDPTGGSSADGGCYNAVECLRVMPELQPIVFSALQQLLSEPGTAVSINERLFQEVINSDDKELRGQFAKYLQVYLQDPIRKNSLKDDLLEVDRRLALMKLFVVVGMPQIWASNDQLRNWFDGRLGFALFRSATFEMIALCPSKSLCGNDQLRETFDRAPPFWWIATTITPEESASLRARGITEVTYTALEMLDVAIHNSQFNLRPLAATMEYTWQGVPYEPLALQTSIRMNGLLN